MHDFETPVPSKGPEAKQLPAEIAIQTELEFRKSEEFRLLFREVAPHEVKTEPALRRSPYAWVQNLEKNGPPRGFGEFGWKSWSADLRAKNFASLQNVLEEIHLDPDQRAAMMGYILGKNDDIRTGHADVTSIRIIPEETKGVCAIEFVCDRYRDVREDRELLTSGKVLRIEIGKKDFALAKKGGYVLPGITPDGIHKQQLAETLLAKQKGRGNMEERVARISYDAERKVITIHAETIGRDMRGRVERHGSVPVAVIEATDFFSPAEIQLLQEATKPRILEERIASFLAEKSQGWTLTEYAELSKHKKEDRSIASLRQLATHVAGPELANRLESAAKKDTQAVRNNHLSVWQKEVCLKAMKLWDAEQERKASKIFSRIGTFFKKLFGGATDTTAARDQAWQELRTQALSLEPRTRTSTEVQWIGGFAPQEGAPGMQPERADATLVVATTVPSIKASFTVTGLKKPIAFGTSQKMFENTKKTSVVA